MPNVPCTSCGESFSIDTDELRERCDQGLPVECDGCIDALVPDDYRRGRGRPPLDGCPTAAELVLRAAEKLAAAGRTVTLPALVVAAWEMAPDRFGLRGYPHPDSKRVAAEVVRLSKRLGKARWSGMLERVGENRYRLTEAGRERLCRLAAAA